VKTVKELIKYLTQISGSQYFLKFKGNSNQTNKFEDNRF